MRYRIFGILGIFLATLSNPATAHLFDPSSVAGLLRLARKLEKHGIFGLHWTILVSMPIYVKIEGHMVYQIDCLVNVHAFYPSGVAGLLRVARKMPKILYIKNESS